MHNKTVWFTTFGYVTIYVIEARCCPLISPVPNVNIDENKKQFKKVEIYMSNEVEIKEKRQQQN